MRIITPTPWEQKILQPTPWEQKYIKRRWAVLGLKANNYPNVDRFLRKDISVFLWIFTLHCDKNKMGIVWVAVMAIATICSFPWSVRLSDWEKRTLIHKGRCYMDLPKYKMLPGQVEQTREDLPILCSWSQQRLSPQKDLLSHCFQSGKLISAYSDLKCKQKGNIQRMERRETWRIIGC